MIQKVSFIGSGNLAWHLTQIFQKKGIEISKIYSRNFISAQELGKLTNAIAVSNIEELIDSDYIFICINDSEIETIPKQLERFESKIVHTSGSISLEKLSNYKGNATGVFYPLQTFRKHHPVNWEEIPIILESNHPFFLEELKEMSSHISNTVVELSSEKRLWLHLSAVFASNFTNGLYGIAKNILEEKRIDFQLLLPLILETANRIHHHSPEEVQTGPAIRKDDQTINMHLELLKSNTELSDLYLLMTKLIQKKTQ